MSNEKFVRRLASLLLVTLIFTVNINISSVASAVQTKETLSFKDTSGHWASDVIEVMYKRGVINGYADGTFKPNANITRAEFLKAMIIAMGIKVTDGDTDFVDDDGWYRKYLDTGLKNGIIAVIDYPNAMFKPNQNITREEIARIAVRTIGEGEDEKNAAKYTEYAWMCERLDILEGYPDGGMGGNKLATRAEAVRILVNTIRAKVPTSVPDYPYSMNGLYMLMKSLPSIKGKVWKSYNTGGVVVNVKDTERVEDSNMAIEYVAEYKFTSLTVWESSRDSRLIVKDILKHYYPKSYEKIYASYLKILELDFEDDRSDIEAKYDGRTVVIYKGNDNKTVVFRIGV